MAPEAAFFVSTFCVMLESLGFKQMKRLRVNITGLDKMKSISHARMSRIVKPVLVPSTVESTKQKVEGTLSDEANM